MLLTLGAGSCRDGLDILSPNFESKTWFNSPIHHRTTTVPPGGFINGTCCDWQWPVDPGHTIGVWCDSTRSTVTYLKLLRMPNEFALRGTIPPDSIEKLTGLLRIFGGKPNDRNYAATDRQIIFINSNVMLFESSVILNEDIANSGRMSSEIQRNSISGPLPSEVVSLTNLQVLAIDNSKMTGLPRNLGSLSLLRGIDCWLENIQDTCRPNPYPSACSRNNVNTPINALPLCSPYTETISATAPPTPTDILPTSIPFSTRSLTSGPTAVETGTENTSIPGISQASLTSQQRKYVAFSSLLGIIVTLLLILLVLRRRLQNCANSVRNFEVQVKKTIICSREES
ncbi:hypothetical protein BKA69DRAFT_839279 [Paraphysoderma sedebokerense]|nr:hypothetical protein BKA69DRAFT_839279 [Paraphysoderma sedebokerense]